jgi:hypothetical protein
MYTEVATLLRNGMTKTDILVLSVLETAERPIGADEIIELADLSVGACNQSLTRLLKNNKIAYQVSDRKRHYVIQSSEREYEEKRRMMSKYM